MIEVKIVLDSMSPAGVRLTTFVLTYPRFIQSEFNTHRIFSRNASSSRAIPIKKQIQMVIDNPAIPIAFSKNKPGMQGGELLEAIELKKATDLWLEARDLAVSQAQKMLDLNMSKQYVNRILEPFAHITVVCTSTDYNNFFALRYHSMAQPEICELAKKMWEAYSSNIPNNLNSGEWHLPFFSPADQALLLCNDLSVKSFEDGMLEGITKDVEKHSIMSSVARCARVSYLNHEGKKPTLAEDLALYDRLVGSTPIHASAAEHQAMAVPDKNVRSGNFRGWIQFRKTLENENIDRFDGPGRTVKS